MTRYVLTSLSCFFDMKPIVQNVTTTLKPEFEKNVEKFSDELRKCLLRRDMTPHERLLVCMRELDHSTNMLYKKYVPIRLTFCFIIL